MKEEWRPVKGLEGHYEISNLGRVKSCRRYILATNFKGNTYKRLVHERILKSADNGKGYEHVLFYYKGRQMCKYVHRLVAEAFLPNPDNLSDVNHKDQNTSNNVLSNLEWLSHFDNNNYGDRNERISKSLRLHYQNKKMIENLEKNSISKDKKRNDLNLLWDV